MQLKDKQSDKHYLNKYEKLEFAMGIGLKLFKFEAQLGLGYSALTNAQGCLGFIGHNSGIIPGTNNPYPRR